MYVPLVVRSAYSLFYGTRLPRELVRAAKTLGYDTLALTDLNNLYGIPDFLEACEEEGIRPLIGATVEQKGQEAVILVKNREGFANLCSLLTRRMMQADTFSLLEDLPRFSQGTVVLTDQPNLLERWRGRVEDLYVRMERVNRSLAHEALRLGIPLVVAEEVLFLEPEDESIHRVLQAIGARKPLAREEVRQLLQRQRGNSRKQGGNSRRSGENQKGNQDTHQDGNQNETASSSFTVKGLWAPPCKVEERFAVLEEGVRNTRKIAEICTFREIFQGFVFPRLPAESLKDLRGLSPAQYLRERVLAGAEERYGEVAEGVLERIEYELSIIEQKGFSEYFLIVADIVKRSSRTCGRGSAAASVVSYCLGITNVDPIRYNLYFERFLNLDRADPPDIDVDFAWDERDAIIEDVFRQYGENHCARVCNHVFYRFPSALRDTARVFGIPDPEITAFEKAFWRTSRRPSPYGMVDESESYCMDCTGVADPLWQEILRIAQRITGLPRNLSVHSGGVVITPKPIHTYVPVEMAEKGVPIVTWEKDGVEAAGLVKIDLLGNRSLAVIRDALANIERNGEAVGAGFRDPTTDPATQNLLAKGATIGVFYVESPAMRQLQAKTGKGDFEHLVIHSSIIRPAANRFINEYVRRLKGEPYQPLHPALDRILAETYGILCYQEDVSKAAVVLAGFSNADADGLRKILSKKNKEARLARYRDQFYEGALSRGVPKETIDRVWEMILSFEGYSFCKAHSASYAMVSFQSAYLKAHHPAEFMAAVLSNRGGYYTPAAYISEARRMGLRILGPDVNHSLYSYTGRGREIRVGFVEIAGLRKETAERIVQERRKGLFRSVEDFARRVELFGEDEEALVSVGALDSIAEGMSRPEQLWVLLRVGAKRREDRGDQELFGHCSEKDLPEQEQQEGKCRDIEKKRETMEVSRKPIRSRRIPTLSPREQMEAEYRRLGFLIEGHVLQLWEPLPKQYREVRGIDLPSYIGRTVRVIGWPVTRKEILTREGNPMEFVSFEDETAMYETILFPKAYQRYAFLLDEPRPFLVSGKVQEELGAVALQVEELSPLPPLLRRNQRVR